MVDGQKRCVPSSFRLRKKNEITKRHITMKEENLFWVLKKANEDSVK